MTVISDDEPIPVLYAIRHCEYGRYPNDTNVLELTDQTIEEIYATRVDWMMSGDDEEDTLRERLKEDLEAFEKEFKTKDWSRSDEDDDE